MNDPKDVAFVIQQLPKMHKGLIQTFEVLARTLEDIVMVVNAIPPELIEKAVKEHYEKQLKEKEKKL